jgi:phosphoenolpyruvate synthase/pyruvate phosphate dikinase
MFHAAKGGVLDWASQHARWGAPMTSIRNDFVRKFRDMGLADIAQVGGKNASLGELLSALVPLGVNVPDFCEFLVEHSIDAISVSPDALARTMRHVVDAEKRSAATRAKQESQ